MTTSMLNIGNRVLVAAKKNTNVTNEGVTAIVPDPSKERVGDRLGSWPEPFAAMPTELTRVSLFSLIRRGRRKFMDWVVLEGRSDVTIKYFGKQLDQADADLWLACLRMGRGTPMGQRIYTDKSSILREIGRNNSGASEAWLVDALKRLAGASFLIELSREGKKSMLTTGMLKWGLEKPSDRMFIRLDPDGAKLFDNLAYIGWEQRLALSSASTKAIHMYICGHKQGEGHFIAMASLMTWCGYEGRIRDFRCNVINALKELEKLKVIHGGKITDRPQGEVVSWVRCASKYTPSNQSK